MMALSCILDFGMLLGCTAAVTGLLGFVFGYPVRRSRTAFRIALAAILALNTTAVFCIADEENAWLATEILLMISAMALPYLLFQRQKRMTFFWFGLTVCSVVDYLEFTIVSFFDPVSRREQQIVFCVLYAVGAAATLIGGKTARRHIQPEFLENIPVVLYLVIFFAEYSTYFSAALSDEEPLYAVAANGLRMLSAALFVGAVSYMIYRFAKQIRRQKEAEARYALELQHYEQIMRKNQDVRAFRHDSKNNLFAVRTLLQNGRIEEAQAYLGDLSRALEQTRSRFSTGNRLADAILTDKAEHAQQKQITFDFDGTIPEPGIPNSVLCTVLANALDNAVEGCAVCAPCTVRIRSVVKNAGMLLEISNPVRQKVVIRDGHVRTSKSDKQNHGFGIHNIRKAAEQCGGSVNLRCSDTEFTIGIGLIFQKGAEE